MEKRAASLRVTKNFTRKNACIHFSNASWAAILFSGFMFIAVFVPYIIAATQGTINPVLPFISQAAGSPPQSGIFSIFLSLTAMTGFLGLHALNLSIGIYQERASKEKQRILQFLNKAALIPGYLALLGMIIVGGFPVDFHRNNEDWILVTIVPHLTGAIILFGGGVIYSSMLTLIMTIIFPGKKKLLCLRIVLLLATILSSLIHAFTVRQAFSLEYYDEDRLDSCSLKIFEYDKNYLICSACEWFMTITFISMFLTLQHEGQMFSVTVAVDLLENDNEGEHGSGSYSKLIPEPSPSSRSTKALLVRSSEVAEGDKKKGTRVKS